MVFPQTEKVILDSKVILRNLRRNASQSVTFQLSCSLEKKKAFKMVYSKTILPGSIPRRAPSPAFGEHGYFKHVMGYSRNTDKLKTKRELAGEVLRVAMMRSFQPPSPILGIWGAGEKTASPRIMRDHSPRLLRSIDGKGISSPSLSVSSAKFSLNSPQVCRATGTSSPKIHLANPKVHLLSGSNSPRVTGRVHKPVWRPKKSVHWKTNIATWIQMTAGNSSVSVSEASHCGDDWRCGRGCGVDNETSDDDGTMKFNTAGKSTCGVSSVKGEDSSDFEYTDFAGLNRKNREVRKYENPYVTSVEDHHSETASSISHLHSPPVRNPLPPPPPSPPPPPPPPENSELHYYSELNCSCDYQGSLSASSSSSHTYEDIDDSIDMNLSDKDSISKKYSRSNSSTSSSSSHTYCEISQVGRGAKPEVFGSLLRNDNRLEALKSTLVHLLPKDDIISTTLLACRLGDLEYLQDLAKQSRLNGRARDLQGATCLHYAARGGHIHILRFLLEDQGERGIVKCDVGATPLHDAAALGHLSVLKYLKKHSRHTLDLTDKDGSTVLHVAAR